MRVPPGFWHCFSLGACAPAKREPADTSFFWRQALRSGHEAIRRRGAPFIDLDHLMVHYFLATEKENPCGFPSLKPRDN